MKAINSSYYKNLVGFKNIKAYLYEQATKIFELLWSIAFGIFASGLLVSCFILFSYKGIKYLYTYTQNEISEYHQKKEDTLNKSIELEARSALSTYREEGLSGLVELSKNRYEQIKGNDTNLEDLYRIATIDMVGETVDQAFLNHMSKLYKVKNDVEIDFSNNSSLKSDYFVKSLTNNRIRKIRDYISDSNKPDTETIRYYIQKVLNRVVSEQLGNDNQLASSTAINIVKTTMYFSNDLIDSFGLAGLHKFSQLCYRELEQSSTISLQQVERCYVVDVFGLTYFVFNKMPRSSTTDYFSNVSARNRPSAFFNKLGISEDDAQRYRKAWAKEFMEQSDEFFQKNEE